MKNKNISISSTEDLASLTSALVVIVLHLYGNSVKSFKAGFKADVDKSLTLLNKFGIKKEFVVFSNQFLMSGDFDESEAVLLGKMLKPLKAQFIKDPAIDKAFISLFYDCVTCLIKESDPAWRRLEKNVSILKNPKFNAIFVPDCESTEQDSIAIPIDQATKRLKAVAVKLGGKADHPFFPVKKVIEFRKDPDLLDLVKEYSLVVKEINKVVKAEIFKYVRSSGKDKVAVADLKAYLKGKNIINDLPTGFEGGLFDEKGQAYTKEGRQLDRVPCGTVIMNKKYDPDNETTYVMNDIYDKNLRYRTLEFTDGNRDAKHAAVKEFYQTESEHRNTWLQDLSKAGSVEQVEAAMVEIMYQTSCRIGGANNKTKGEPTYGLTTLQVNHILVKPKVIEFNYSGKKAAEQHHELKTTTTEGGKVASVIKKLIAGKKPTDLVFTASIPLKSGKTKVGPVTATMVNSYLKSIGIGITAHKFRQLAGTKAAMGILGRSPYKKGKECNQREVEVWVKEELKKVGEILHHRSGTAVTGMTAVKSYISPEVLKEFFTNLNLRIPSWVPKA